METRFREVADGLATLVVTVPRLSAATMNFGRAKAVFLSKVMDARARHDCDVALEANPLRVRQDDRQLLLSDCSRAEEALGWKAEASLVDGLREALHRPLVWGVAAT